MRICTASNIREHDIDVFVPTHKRALFAGVSMPCPVKMPADWQTLDLLEDKFRFSKQLVGEPYYLPCTLVRTCAELEKELENFHNTHKHVDPCIKPNRGVNGHGFWILSRSASAFAHLINPDARRIREDLFVHAFAAMQQDATLQPMIVMPYLSGPEVSLDVLASSGAVLKYIARTKKGTRQHLQSSHPLDKHVRALIERFALDGLVNVQFRRDADECWKVLEINTRPAGGSIYAESFGAALVSDWGALLTGHLTPQQITQTPVDVQVQLTSSMQKIS